MTGIHGLNNWKSNCTEVRYMAQVDIYNLQRWREMAGISGYNADLLSKEMKISRRQLQRYTHKLFGLSPQHWLNQQRLSVAAELLREHRSVKQVAYHLGFKQVSHFSREFKLHFGVCPVSYLDWNDQVQNESTSLSSIQPKLLTASSGHDVHRR